MPRPGEPLPFGKQVPELILNETGDVEEGDGAKASIIGHKLVFKCAGNGAEFFFSVDVVDILNAISEYNKKYES